MYTLITEGSGQNTTLIQEVQGGDCESVVSNSQVIMLWSRDHTEPEKAWMPLSRNS